MTARDGDIVDERPLPGWALAGAAVTLLAVALEFLGSFVGDSPSTAYPGWLVTFAWPAPLRVVWWLLAAGGAVAASHGLSQATGRPRPLRTVLVAAPFLLFAGGVAAGASWATWH
ncbi:MAG: hypothetical protein KY461_04610 [Actinobacteria bacterium]|nr:hypothetical protein [Actinomycetota bacterium]